MMAAMTGPEHGVGLDAEKRRLAKSMYMWCCCTGVKLAEALDGVTVRLGDAETEVDRLCDWVMVKTNSRHLIVSQLCVVGMEDAFSPLPAGGVDD